MLRCDLRIAARLAFPQGAIERLRKFLLLGVQILQSLGGCRLKIASLLLNPLLRGFDRIICCLQKIILLLCRLLGPCLNLIELINATIALPCGV